jgi:hypothetical protein
MMEVGVVRGRYLKVVTTQDQEEVGIMVIRIAILIVGAIVVVVVVVKTAIPPIVIVGIAVMAMIMINIQVEGVIIIRGEEVVVIILMEEVAMEGIETSLRTLLRPKRRLMMMNLRKR